MFRNLSAPGLGISCQQSELIELALTYRFRGIDVRIEDFLAEGKTQGTPYTRRLIDSAKIRVGRLALPLNLGAEEEAFQKELGELALMATAAAELGATLAVLVIDPASDEHPYHENFELHRRRLGAVCQTLEPQGVRLAVGLRAAAASRKGKAFQFIHTFDALAMLLGMVGAKNLGLQLDLWELAVSGGSLETLQSLPSVPILDVQLADLPEDKPVESLTEADRLLPAASGTAAPLLAWLKEKGFDGPVTLKVARKAFDSSARRDDIAKAASATLDALWAEAGLSSGGRSALRSAE